MLTPPPKGFVQNRLVSALEFDFGGFLGLFERCHPGLAPVQIGYDASLFGKRRERDECI
jgi:hypothetical protein